MAETIAYKPIRFFTLTFVVTWVCWFAAPYLGDPETGDAIFPILMLTGLLTPFATALYLTLASKNNALKKTFFNKLLNIRLIRLSSIPLFLILFPASMIVSILISTLFGYSFDQFTVAEEFLLLRGGHPNTPFSITCCVFRGARLERLCH